LPRGGTIDPAQADFEWGAQTDPGKQRDQQARQVGADMAAGLAKVAATKPVPQAAIRARPKPCALSEPIRAAGQPTAVRFFS
jgi:hypothetical protein